MAHILVVEDSKAQGIQIQRILESEHFDVTLTHHGLDALALLRKSVPDLVLTDMDMPGMNGLEIVEAIRKEFPEVPVILMTAIGSEELAVKALQKGAASYVPKKNLVRDIHDTVANILSVSQGTRHEKRA